MWFLWFSLFCSGVLADLFACDLLCVFVCVVFAGLCGWLIVVYLVWFLFRPVC